MRFAFSFAVLCVVMTVALAAPLPKGVALEDKYLLDDMDMIAVVNVPLIQASALYKDHYEKMLGDVLKKEPVAALLKEAGVDPLKDVDRVVMMIGHSCFPEKGQGGPVLLVQGRFDPAKVYAAAAKLAKDYPAVVKIEARGDAKIVQFGDGFQMFHAVVLDKNNVFVSANKSHVETALDKTAGKTKTDFKNKPFVEMYRKLKFDRPVEVIATGTMVTGTSSRTDGMKTERTVHTLAESGVDGFRATLDVKDKVKLQVTIRAKDAATATEMAKRMGEEIKREAGQAPKEFAAVGKAMATAKFESKDKDILIEGEGDAEAVQQMLNGRIFGGRSAPAPKPVEPGETKPALPR
jgi:hypothetical protein